MSSTSRSVQIYGLYLVIVGLILLFVPNMLLLLFGFPPTKEPHIRLLGAVVVCVGYFYLVAAAEDLRPFAKATVYGRAWIFLSFVGLVALGLTKPMALLFGALDLAGAAWTWSSLRIDRSKVAFAG